MLIDSHAHLFDLEDPQGVIDSMEEDGLEAAVCVGYDLESSRKAAELARGNARVYAAAGVHPSSAAEYDEKTGLALEELCKHEKVVALGEFGLDYHYDNTDRAAQKRAMCAQAELLDTVGLPAVFHLRDAYEDMFSLIKQNLGHFKNGAVLHCFSGSREEALRYVDLGFYLSFTGAVTFKNARRAPEILAALPKDRVLIETDCPYLSPEPFRGRANAPKNVRYVAARLAEIWGMSEQETAALTARNTKRLFSRMR